MNALKDDLDHNIEVHRTMALQAREAGASLIVFPELSTTAHYGDESAVDLAQDVDRGRVYDELNRLARELECTIGYGVCERARGTFFNSYVLMSPRGIIGVQRKVHASLDEYLYFRMGGRLDVFSVEGLTVGVAICVDAGYFEVWRVFALKGADVVLLPHAGRSGHGARIEKGEQERQIKTRIATFPGRYGTFAAENLVYAAYCNQVGYNGHSTHSGGAWICGPDGDLLTVGEPVVHDTFVITRLDPERLHAARRSRYSTLRTRRPEVYGEITEMR